MKKKIKIVTHGNTWVDTSTPIVCPECASLNIKEYTHDNSEWYGPFYINHSEKICFCEDCNCHFKISKDKKSISRVCVDKIFGIISMISAVIFAILAIFSCIFWGCNNPLPAPMVIAIIADSIIGIISLFIWLMTT